MAQPIPADLFVEEVEATPVRRAFAAMS